MLCTVSVLSVLSAVRLSLCRHHVLHSALINNSQSELHRTPRHGGRKAKTFNRFVATHMPNEYIVCIAQQNSNLEFVSFFMYDIFDTVPFF